MADMLSSIRFLRGAAERRLGVDDIAASHGGFIWASLQRFGVRERDLADVAQEVLIIVHRRLADYDPSRPLRPWLYGICLRAAIGHRRRAWVRRELPVESFADEAGDDDPERAVADREARAHLAAILDAMDPEKRSVIVMHEIEGLSCEEIAAIVGVPVGTVYSRLHAARHAFTKQFERLRARWGGR